MAVTFTNKAAKEMLTRLTAMLPVNAGHVDRDLPRPVQPLPARALEAGCLPQSFQILDSSDTVSRHQARDQGDEPGRGALVPKQVGWFIAGCKEDGHRPATGGA